MAISKQKKVRMVDDYLQRLSQSQAVILTDYRGMTVANITELRARLREMHAAYQVIKNSLFERALEERGIPVPAEHLQGPIAVSYCSADVAGAARVLRDFAKETGVLTFKGAFFGKAFLDAEAAQALADLPPREFVLAQLLGTVQGPLTSLVSTIAAPMREIVQVLQARSSQDALGEPAAA